MPIDFAADLAVMFDVEAFGQPANYVPAAGGAPVSIVVMLDTPQLDIESAGLKVLADGRTVHIQAADIADPRHGDQLTINGVTYRIHGAPRRSDDGLVWVAEIAETEGA